MTNNDIVHMLIKAGVRYRTGGGDHYIFYPDSYSENNGILVVPTNRKQASKKLRGVIAKCLSGKSYSRNGLRKNS